MYQQVKDHILGLGDAELIEYVLNGRRLYDADAVEFARAELRRRNLPAEQTAAVRQQVAANLMHADAKTGPTISPDVQSVLCQRCGVEAPTRFARYDQNVGLLFFRLTKHYEGWLCRPCNHGLFWNVTTVNLLLGWWGLISFFINIPNLIGNTITFARTRGMSDDPPGSGEPILDDEAISKVAPHYALIADRLLDQHDANDIAREIAPLANVTPGQAWLYVKKVRDARVFTLEPPTHAFPIIIAGDKASTG